MKFEAIPGRQYFVQLLLEPNFGEFSSGGELEFRVCPPMCDTCTNDGVCLTCQTEKKAQLVAASASGNATCLCQADLLQKNLYSEGAGSRYEALVASEQIERHEQARCVTCPQHATCLAGAAHSAAGFYPEKGTSGDTIAFKACLVPEACVGNGQCSDGYTGYLCAQCSKGYYRKGQECLECPKTGALRLAAIIIAFVAVVIAAIGIALAFRKTILAIMTEWRSEFTLISIGVQYVQIISTFRSMTDVRWPITTAGTMDIFSVTNLNLDLLAAECVADSITYDVKFGLTMLFPAIVGALLVISFMIMRCCATQRCIACRSACKRRFACCKKPACCTRDKKKEAGGLEDSESGNTKKAGKTDGDLAKEEPDGEDLEEEQTKEGGEEMPDEDSSSYSSSSSSSSARARSGGRGYSDSPKEGGSDSDSGSGSGSGRKSGSGSGSPKTEKADEEEQQEEEEKTGKRGANRRRDREDKDGYSEHERRSRNRRQEHNETNCMGQGADSPERRQRRLRQQRDVERVEGETNCMGQGADAPGRNRDRRQTEREKSRKKKAKSDKKRKERRDQEKSEQRARSDSSSAHPYEDEIVFELALGGRKKTKQQETPKKRNGDEDKSAGAAVLISSGISIFNLTQILILKRAFEAFSCDFGGSKLFLPDPRYTCYEDAFTMRLLVGGVIAIGLYGVIIPIAIFWTLSSLGKSPESYHHSTNCCGCRRPLVPKGCDTTCCCVCDNGDYAEEVNRVGMLHKLWRRGYAAVDDEPVPPSKLESDQTVVTRYLGNLYRSYWPHCFLWEAVVVVRKIIVVACATFLPLFTKNSASNDTYISASVLSAVFLIMGIVEAAACPYRVKQHTIIEVFLFFCAAVILALGAVCTSLRQNPSVASLDKVTVAVLAISVCAVCILTVSGVVYLIFKKYNEETLWCQQKQRDRRKKEKERRERAKRAAENNEEITEYEYYFEDEHRPKPPADGESTGADTPATEGEASAGAAETTADGS